MEYKGERSMMTNNGLTEIANFLGSSTAVVPAFFGNGLGTTAPAQTQTVLFNEVYPTTTRNTTTKEAQGFAVRFRNSIGLTEGTTTTGYRELGLFSVSTTGVMFCRVVQPATRKDSSVQLENYHSMFIDSRV